MTLVGAFQSPHLPLLPGLRAYQQSERSGEPPANPAEAVFAMLAKVHPRACDILDALGQQLLDLKPDVLVMLDSDHLNTFFLNHIPSIAIGVGEETNGPSDHPPGHVVYSKIPLDLTLGRKLHSSLIEKEFDVSAVQRFTVDHSVTVPLHFLTPDMTVPLVPVYINGLADPLISSRRAAALGRAIAETLDEVYADRRIVLVSSGAISLEIGGPRVHAGSTVGVPDPQWVERVTELVTIGDLDQLVAETTKEQIRYSGNAAGEILNLISLLGALDERRRPEYIEADISGGFAYASWIC